MKQTLRATLALAITLLPSVALADKSIDDVPKPDQKAALLSWTPVQQWHGGGAARKDYGYSNHIGALLLADELGDRLSELGRARLIEACMDHQHASIEGLMAWTICGNDVKTLDLKKLESELTAEGIGGPSKASVLADVKETLAKAKAVGDAIEAVKADSGVAQVLRLGDTARAEWTTYLSKSKADVDRYLALKDAVRSAKADAAAFTGCYAATQPAFAKVVKAAAPKIPYDTDRDAMYGYMYNYMPYILTSKESYLATVSYAACLWGLHDSASIFLTVAANPEHEHGHVIAGPRTITLLRIKDESFKPKFNDRSLRLSLDTSFNKGPNFRGASSTGGTGKLEGVIGTLTPAGDMVKVAFKGESFERCIQYANDVNKTCLKRGQVYDAVGAGDVYAKFMTGVKAGMSLAIQYGFPEVAWNSKAKKLTTLMTIPLQ